MARKGRMMTQATSQTLQDWGHELLAPQTGMARVLVLDPDWASVAAVAEAVSGQMLVTSDVSVQRIDLILADPATFPILDIKRLHRTMPDVPLVLYTNERRSARLFEWFALLRIERTLQKPATGDQLEAACRLAVSQTKRHGSYLQMCDALLGLLAGAETPPPDWPHSPGVFRDLKALISGVYFHAATPSRIDRVLEPVLQKWADTLKAEQVTLRVDIEASDLLCDGPLVRQMLACMLSEGLRVARFGGEMNLRFEASETGRVLRLTAQGGRTRQPPRWPVIEAYLSAGAGAHGGRYSGAFKGAALSQMLELPHAPQDVHAGDA